ncbi:MAG: hypothetical protein Q7T82_16670 [Armatimonadota bacterium]|nr:hypothetical protein [Armatimonadota bacterium]
MKLTILLVVAILLALTVSALAAVPPIINYQGKLMQPSGAPVPDGAYTVQFAIYDAPTVGNPPVLPLWSETNNAVQVKGGLFSVLLGSVNNLPANIFDSPNRFFGVKVGSDPEMTPRQQIASVPYAQVAGNGIPVGGIIIWSGAANQIPQGWALCDGTNGTPNLRDKFIVGAGSEYAVGDEGGLKEVTLTVGQMPSHVHQEQAAAQNDYGGTDGQVAGSGRWGALSSGSGIMTLSAGGDQPHENRPPYYALCFIMKLGY